MKNLLTLLLFLTACQIQAQDGTFTIKNDDTYSSEEVFKIVEQMPQWSGCDSAADPQKCTERKMMEFISYNLKLPTYTEDTAPHTKVYISFVVATNGTVTNVMSMRNTDDPFSKQCVEVVESFPPFLPGRQRGAVVPVQLQIPITIHYR